MRSSPSNAPRWRPNRRRGRLASSLPPARAWTGGPSVPNRHPPTRPDARTVSSRTTEAHGDNYSDGQRFSLRKQRCPTPQPRPRDAGPTEDKPQFRAGSHSRSPVTFLPHPQAHGHGGKTGVRFDGRGAIRSVALTTVSVLDSAPRAEPPLGGPAIGAEFVLLKRAETSP